MNGIIPLVYVSCMTYNHAKYIKDAMDGFCMQQTNFPFVCGIIDDASTDGEQEVIQKYLEEHFDLEESTTVRRDVTDDYIRIFAQHKINKNCFFVVIYLKNNHYSLNKTKWTYVSKWREKAKYIAVCEGDDYWIDQSKLQEQVDFMEIHSDFGLIYTRAKIFNQENNKFDNTVGSQLDSYRELLLSNPIPTLTVLYRNIFDNDYNIEIKPYSSGWKMGDYPKWLYISSKSNIYFLNKITAIYRVTEGSASRPNEFISKIKFIESTRDIRLFFCDKYINNNIKIKQQINELCTCKVILKCIKFQEYGQLLEFIKHSNLYKDPFPIFWGLTKQIFISFYKKCKFLEDNK